METSFLSFFVVKLKQIHIDKGITAGYSTNIPQCLRVSDSSPYMNLLRTTVFAHQVSIVDLVTSLEDVRVTVTVALSDTAMKLESPLVMASSQQISIHAPQDKSSSYFKCHRRFLSL